VKDEAYTRLAEEMEALRQEEREVKEHIQRMTALLQQEGEEASQLMYVTQEDLGALPCYDGETVIAIRAPQGEESGKERGIGGGSRSRLSFFGGGCRMLCSPLPSRLPN